MTREYLIFARHNGVPFGYHTPSGHFNPHARAFAQRYTLAEAQGVVFRLSDKFEDLGYEFDILGPTEWVL